MSKSKIATAHVVQSMECTVDDEELESKPPWSRFSTGRTFSFQTFQVNSDQLGFCHHFHASSFVTVE